MNKERGTLLALFLTITRNLLFFQNIGEMALLHKVYCRLFESGLPYLFLVYGEFVELKVQISNVHVRASLSL